MVTKLAVYGGQMIAFALCNDLLGDSLRANPCSAPKSLRLAINELFSEPRPGADAVRA
jgi:hypothetical protein